MGESKTKCSLRVLSGITLCLLCAVVSTGQTSPQNVVLLRNVQIADDTKKELVKADVLIVGGQLVRVRDGSPIPIGATVIDGGGNELTVDKDGSFRLSPINQATKESTAQTGVATDSSPTQTRKVGLGYRSIPFQTAITKPDKTEVDFTLRRETKLNRTRSQQTQQPAQQGGDLAQQVTDPSAPLSTITFQNKYIPSHWGIDDDENEFDIQVALPYRLAGKPQIFRATIPFRTNTIAPGNNGVGDVALLNVTILPQKWGNFLIGPVASFGNNKGPGVDTFAIGPAIGAIFKKEKWTYGVFSQNLFSFGGDIATTQIQPVLAYTVNKKVSLALGDDQIAFDWKKEKFVSIPLSGQINYIALFGKQPVRFFFNAQYNLRDEFSSRKWTLTPGFALILR